MPDRELTPEEQVVNAETMRHILTVRAMLMECVHEMTCRSDAHDRSKLSDPEVAVFAEYTDILAGLTFGSDEYKTALAEMKPALDHHYANNRHHPEYHDDGIDGMDLFDLLEMLVDWKSATLRHADGDINESLRKNAKRHNIPKPIVRLLANTIPVVQRMAQRANVAVSYPHIEGSAGA